MAEDFTHAGYAELLSSLAAKGYAAVSYAECMANRAHLILRHDIDMSIDAAVPIARIEAAAGMKAHYFVLLRSELYNPNSPAARAGIEEIRHLGHEVGLHFDASLYGEDEGELEAAATRECATFAAITGFEAETISFHRPAQSLLGREAPIAGRLHSYQPKFFNEIGYCSDSRGGWHYGHPLDHEAVRDGRAIQLLTHPIWWRGAATTVQRRLDSFAGERYALLRVELGRNCTAFDSSIKPAVAPQNPEEWE